MSYSVISDPAAIKAEMNSGDAPRVWVKCVPGSHPDCCLCGKVCENEFGNNPRPVPHNKGEDGVCCNKCNSKKVIPARMAGRF